MSCQITLETDVLRIARDVGLGQHLDLGVTQGPQLEAQVFLCCAMKARLSNRHFYLPQGLTQNAYIAIHIEQRPAIGQGA